MNEIVPFIYVGNIRAAGREANDFSMIVNCTPEVPFYSPAKTQIRINVDDAPEEWMNMYNQIVEKDVLRKIRETVSKKEKVLIHCHAGIQRSCAVMACYLIVYHGLSIENTIRYIKSRRRVAFYGDVHFIRTIQAIYEQNK